MVERDDTQGRARALLNDSMLDLDRPVKVVFPDGYRNVHNVVRTKETMEETLRERGDRNYIFSASLPLAFDWA